MSFLRLRQPAITRLNPHAGNRRFIIPNRLGQATSTLELGLVTQSDVNTRGRSDDLPFDHVLGNVGTPVNGPTVGSAGDGGFVPMDYAAGAYVTLPSVPGVTDNDFLESDFTMAVRCSTVAQVGEQPTYGFGPGALVALKITNSNGGNPLAFDIDDGGGSTNSTAGNVNSDDGVEHVIIQRRSGGRVQLLWEKGLLVDNDQAYGTLGATTTGLQSLAVFFDDTPGNTLVGSIWWSACWDRNLTNDELIALVATPNPFV
jgi:hypothetical protein